MDDDEAPLPRGGYNIDFDSIDLDNFNPFATKTKVANTFDDNAPLGASRQNFPGNLPTGPEEPISKPSAFDSPTSQTNSPDENKNPNIQSNVRKTPSFKTRAALKKKPMAARKAEDKDKDKEKDGAAPAKPREKKQSLKDKIAEMRKKKEQEKRSQEANSVEPSGLSATTNSVVTNASANVNVNSNTLASAGGPNGFGGSSGASLEAGSSPAGLLPKLLVRNQISSDGSVPNTAASDVNLPDSAASDRESMRSGQAPCFGFEKRSTSKSPEPAPAAPLNETDFATPQASPSRSKTPIVESSTQNSDHLNALPSHIHQKPKAPSEEQESKLSLYESSTLNNDLTMEDTKIVTASTTVPTITTTTSSRSAVNGPRTPLHHQPASSGTRPHASSSASASASTSSGLSQPLPKASQDMLNLCKTILNSLQRDYSIYEESLSRYQQYENKQIKEAADRAEIEEEYNQIKVRYDKLRENQKKSQLPSIRNNVNEQTARNEGRILDCSGRSSSLMKDFDEFKKKQHSMMMHLTHENTVLKGNLKIAEQKNSFMSRKVETQNEMATTARKQQQETEEELQIALNEIKELRELNQSQQEQIMQQANKIDHLVQSNKGLEDLVEELMPLQ